MKHDEFAFFNQQLAGMLREGLPLEGALKQLCATMRRGGLRAELGQLAGDLSSGVPLDEALEGRRLPRLYVRMLKVGRRGNNLPGVLTLLADYHRRLGNIWARLAGVMVYPAIVLFVSFALSLFLLLQMGDTYRTLTEDLLDMGWEFGADMTIYKLLVPPVALGGLIVLGVCLVATRAVRQWLSWHVGPFRDAKLAQTAAALGALLRGGCPLDEALAMMVEIEDYPPVRAEFARWQDRLAAGYGTLSEMTAEGRIFPPLFLWLAEGSGEDPAQGFEDAAQLYDERAAHGVDMLLYGALPVSIVILGVLVFAQVHSVFAPLLRLMTSMSQM